MATAREIAKIVNIIRKELGPEAADMAARPSAPDAKRVRIANVVPCYGGTWKEAPPGAAGKIVAHTDGKWTHGWIIDLGDRGLAYVGHDEGAVIHDEK